MKYAIFFLLVVVAMAAAAPQLLVPNIYGGVAPYYGSAPGTVVAGPTVVNNPLGFGGRYLAPGYIGGYY